MKNTKDIFILAAEAFGLVLFFIQPLKFGAILGTPSMTLTYHTDLLSLAIASWPQPFFILSSAVFLGLTLFVPCKGIRIQSALFIFFWSLLAFAGFLGAFHPNAGIIHSIQFVSYLFALTAAAIGLNRLLEYDDAFGNKLLAALAAGSFFSLFSAYNQYFAGFDDTIHFLQKNNFQPEQSEMNWKILMRLKESRVSADFSICNTYAGYLTLILPITAVLLWKVGGKIEPGKITRPLLTILYTAGGIFILLKTGSRGALLALTGAVFITLLIMPIRKKIKYILYALIPFAIGAFACAVFVWRGAKSILFRLDYFQGAFRLMAGSPFNGIGWGRFQEEFFFVKYFIDKEAPASPHNMLLALGTACGILAFLFAAAVLVFPLFSGFRRIHIRSVRESFSDDFLTDTITVFALCAWTLHAMQDISFETPASMMLALAVGSIILSKEPMEKSWKNKLIISLLSAAIMILTFAGGFRFLRYDCAYATFADSADVRMVPADKISKLSQDQALSMYNACEKAEPSAPFHDMLMSSLLAYFHDMDGALSFLDKAISKNPKSASLHNRKYLFLRTIPGREQDARKELETARQLAPRNPLYQEDQ